MAYLKGYMVPPGQGGNITMDEATYRALEEQSSEAQHTGVYDPDKYFWVDDIDVNGWVKTAPQTAYANSDRSLVFLHNSIKTTSLIQIVAEASDTEDMPVSGDNDVTPIYAKVDFQNDGSCGIKFDKQPVDTKFWLLIRNMEGLEDQIDYIPNDQGRYSTNEIVVGMWIDGKPLYRIVVPFTLGTITDGTDSSVGVPVTDLNCDTVIIRNAFVKRDTGMVPMLNYNFATDGHDRYIRVQFRRFSGIAQIEVYTNYGNFSNQTGYVILEYTKTTDTV